MPLLAPDSRVLTPLSYVLARPGGVSLRACVRACACVYVNCRRKGPKRPCRYMPTRSKRRPSSPAFPFFPRANGHCRTQTQKAETL